MDQSTPSSLQDLRRLRVLVTGGTSGLGRALVDEFDHHGASVAFVARTETAVARVAREVPRALGIAGDVADKQAIHRIALQALAWRGGIDVLINNASSLGPVPLAPLADTACEAFEEALITNVLGPFRLTKALQGALSSSAREGRGGVVVNVVSDAAVNAYPNWGAYGASKAALSHMTRIWNEECGPLGVQLLSFDPGDMDTPLHALAVPDARPHHVAGPASVSASDDRLRCPRGEALEVSGFRCARRTRSRLPMIAADSPIPRPADARLLVIDGGGHVLHASRARWLDYLDRGDLVIANDAATLPASLTGWHARSGAAVELRLAAWRSSMFRSPVEFDAVVFGSGDYRTRTEDRAPPPPLEAGDGLIFGPLLATVTQILVGARLVRVRFDMPLADFWRGLARHGKPIQYAHIREPLALWDVWTTIAAIPAAFEAPSAGFILDWRDLASLPARGIRFATLTHAAGLSSTGDPDLDRRLPLDEWYRIPEATAKAVQQARRHGASVIAIGTTVVRAIEHAARNRDEVRSGEGVATGRIGASTKLRIVDAVAHRHARARLQSP